MDRKPKTIFQLDSPFTAVQWPQVSLQNQETILELLCSLLSPIGQYRFNRITPSKGKRSKKRKQKHIKSGTTSTTLMPPPPEISSFVVVGLRAITRGLEASSRKLNSKSTPSLVAHDKEGGTGFLDTLGSPGKTKQVERNKTPDVDDCSHSPFVGHFSAIFVARSSQPSILHAHLPQLIASASPAHPELPATKLVQLPKGSGARLCEALGLPRVSFIAILEGSPNSKALIDLVRECVPEIEVPWLHGVVDLKYLPVNIKAIETFVSTMKRDMA